MSSSKIIVLVFTPVDDRCHLDEARARLSDRETSKSNVKNIIIHQSWITKTTTKYLSILQSVLRNYPPGTVLTFLLNIVTVFLNSRL